MPKFRFSIQSMLLFTAVVGIGAWWLGSPSVNAARFGNAVRRMQYQRAGDMFVHKGESMMLTQWDPIVRAHTAPQKLTAKDLLYGRRRIALTISYQSTTKEIAHRSLLEADYRGIHWPDAANFTSRKSKLR